MSAGVRVVGCDPMRSASGLTAPRSRSFAPARPARPIHRGVLPHGPPQGAVNDKQMISLSGSPPQPLPPPRSNLNLLLSPLHGPVRRWGQRQLGRALAREALESLLNQAAPADEPGAVVLERAKFAEYPTPGCGPRTLALTVVDVLRQHRAAGFHVSQLFARQRIRLAQRFLLRNLADDRASVSRTPRFFERLDLDDHEVNRSLGSAARPRIVTAAEDEAEQPGRQISRLVI
jgi:hypothetical protein